MKPKVKNPKVARTRNLGTMTEAEYWGKVRGALRKAFAHWVPMVEAINLFRRPSEHPTNKRLKWEYQCQMCLQWFQRKEVVGDHVEPVGELNSGDDIKGWLERLTFENITKGQPLCKCCHQIKSNGENAGRRRARIQPVEYELQLTNPISD